MKIKFYTLLYVAHDEVRQMEGKVWEQQERIDVFVKNACVLDKTLRLCCAAQGVDGCTILTNDEAAIRASLQRVGSNIGGGKIHPLYS